MTINGGTNASGWTFKLEAYEIGSYSITNNTSTVRVDMYLGRANSQSYLGGNWSGSITVDGQYQSISGNIPYPTYINAGGWLPLGTRDYTITHNTDGSKVAGISASFSSSDFSPSSAWASGDLTLTTIPRASSITATNADIESATTIVINRASSSFTHTITYSFGELSGTIATKTTETTIGFTLPSTFYAEIPNRSAGTCTITCETYNGNTLIGTKTTTFFATANQDLCKPEITASAIDTNADTIALTGDNTKFIKYHSNASVAWTATAKNSASITRVYVNDEITTDNPKIINNIVQNQISLGVLDSRAYMNRGMLDLTMVDYIPLSASVSFYRTAPTTGQVSLEFSGNYFNDSFGNTNNSLTLKWYYKEKNAQNWTTGGTLVLNTDYVINENTFHSGTGTYTDDIILGSNFDYQKAYDFKIEIYDELEIRTIEQTVSKGIPIINWNDDHFNVNGEITQYEEPLTPSGGGETLPVGTILEYPASSNLPTGWMICDGSAISRTEYSQLFNVIGTSFGSGDGSTTFNIPNKKGRVSVGVDTSQTEFNTIGKTGGSKDLQEHSHSSIDGNFATENVSAVNAYGSGNATLYKLGRASTTATAGTGNSGNLQPYIVTNFIIKVSETTPIQAQVVDSLDGDSRIDAPSVHAVKTLNLVNTYSTSEIKVGTWINDKPIYRKVIQTTMPTSTGWQSVATLLNVNEIISLHGRYSGNDGRQMMIPYSENGYLQAISYQPNSNSIEINSQNIAWSNKPLTIIVEYTKTTD